MGIAVGSYIAPLHHHWCPGWSSPVLYTASLSKSVLSSHQQQQAGPVYEEMVASSAKEKIELRTWLMDPYVQTIELKENIAYAHR